MSASKLKNYRYRIIDQILRSQEDGITLKDLIDQVSTRLFDEFGIKKVSKRTIQYDLALMREKNPKGFNAPIVCDTGLYRYADIDFSIDKAQLSEPDIANLKEAITILKQFKNFSHIGDLHGIIGKIDNIVKLNPGPGAEEIQFQNQTKKEKETEWLPTLYNAILEKSVLELNFHTNNKEEIFEKIIHPYLLKEYENDWYLIGLNEEKDTIETIAVETIARLSIKILPFKENQYFDAKNYFDKIIGTHVSEGSKVQKVVLWLSKDVSEYYKQHPLHSSQEIVSENEEGITISLKVIVNLELEEIILSLGHNVKVEGPDNLRKKIISELKASYEAYFKLSLF